MFELTGKSVKTGFTTNPKIKIEFKIGYFKPDETISIEPYNVEERGGNIRWYQSPTHDGCLVSFYNGDARWLVDKMYAENPGKQKRGSSLIFENGIHSYTVDELKDIFDNLPFSVRARLIKNTGGNSELKFSYKKATE